MPIAADLRWSSQFSFRSVKHSGEKGERPRTRIWKRRQNSAWSQVTTFKIFRREAKVFFPKNVVKLKSIID